MISIIAKRHFLSNIFTLRFTISFIVCIILFIASALILNWDYSERVNQYGNQESKSQESLDRISTYAGLSVTVNRPPSPLSTIAEGADKRLGTSTIVGFDRAPTIVEESGTDNPLLSVFPSFDIITIIQIIMSLLTLLFAYNTISGERENGTLKLVLSNSMPRHTVILGNYLGGMTSLILPLFMGLILALIITVSNSYVSFNSALTGRVLLIFVFSILYLSVFYTLGILISSRIRRSATVLIILLFIWVLFVIILPPTTVYLTKQISPVQDKTTIDDQARQLRNEWDREMAQYISKNPRPKHDYDFIRGRNVRSGDMPYAYRIWYAPREVMQWLVDGSIYGHNLRLEYEDRIWQLYKDYQSQLKGQSNLAKSLSMLSPSWIFSYSSSLIAGTDEENYIRFLNQAQDYRQELINYIRSKSGLSSYKLITRNSVDHYLPYQELLNIRANNGTSAIEDIIGPGGGWDTADPLYLDDLPRFNFRNETVSSSIIDALPGILILLFLNLILFTFTWISFLKADVR
ncbi:ABC transporter permease subunit [candidate division KSB1 bacterium]